MLQSLQCQDKYMYLAIQGYLHSAVTPLTISSYPMSQYFICSDKCLTHTVLMVTSILSERVVFTNQLLTGKRGYIRSSSVWGTLYYRSKCRGCSDGEDGVRSLGLSSWCELVSGREISRWFNDDRLLLHLPGVTDRIETRHLYIFKVRTSCCYSQVLP